MKKLDVCAAVVPRGGKLLLATRPPGTHLAGKWEFPGGKIRPDETHKACIQREIREELGLELEGTRFLTTVDHTYPEKQIRLFFMLCTIPDESTPVGHEGQSVDWFSPTQLLELDLAPADRVFVNWLVEDLPSFWSSAAGQRYSHRR